MCSESHFSLSWVTKGTLPASGRQSAIVDFTPSATCVWVGGRGNKVRRKERWRKARKEIAMKEGKRRDGPQSRRGGREGGREGGE